MALPVKSLGGEQVEHTEFSPRGVLGDRLWAIRDLERGITASARQLPVLLTATARYRGPVPPDAGPGNVPEVEITFPDGAILSSTDGGVNAKLSQLAGRDVELTALPPAEDTSLHRLNRDQRADAMSPASLRAAFGVSERRSCLTSRWCGFRIWSPSRATRLRQECSSTWPLCM